MRKTIFVLILMLGIIFGVFCQSPAAGSGPMDLVVLLDTSTSMSNYYRQTSDYLIGPFLKEFLRIGDTFHLISFSNTPRVEISRRIENVGDVEAVIGRLLLMYPLDPQTDVAGALNFGETYSKSLPSRSTKIVLVTDGDTAGVQNLVNDSTGRLKNQGIDLQYIKVPVAGTGPSSGRAPAQSTAISAPKTTAVPAASAAPAAPASSTTSSAPVSQPSAQTQPSTSAGVTSTQPQATQTQTTQTPQTQTPQTQTTQSQTTQAPASQASPASSAPSSAPTTTPAASAPVQTAQSTPTQPSPSQPAPSQPAPVPSQASAGQTQQTASSSGSSGSLFDSGIPLWLLILLIILALLILGLLAFFIARRLQSSPNRAMAQAAAPSDTANLMSSYADQQKKQARSPLEYPPKEMKPLPKDKVYKEEELVSSGDGDPIMLNLFVEDQNTAIGRRNIHNVKAGYTFSVGGGKSDFLIFLVPMPPHIADVTYDGRNCTFIPRKPQLFPDIGSQTVPSCIGKSIRVMSEKNYELHIRMERYQDPLKELNKMLHSITVPG